MVSRNLGSKLHVIKIHLMNWNENRVIIVLNIMIWNENTVKILWVQRREWKQGKHFQRKKTWRTWEWKRGSLSDCNLIFIWLFSDFVWVLYNWFQAALNHIFTWTFNLKCLKNCPRNWVFRYPNGIPRTALGCFWPDLSIWIALKMSYQPFSSKADGYWSFSEPSQSFKKEFLISKP